VTDLDDQGRRRAAELRLRNRPLVSLAAVLVVAAAGAMALVVSRDDGRDGASRGADAGKGVAQGGDKAAVADTPELPPADPSLVGPKRPRPASGGVGTLAVDLEPIEGVIYEGFDVTLQFRQPSGEPLAERRWTESLGALGPTAAPGDILSQYGHVLRERVPAGTVRLVTVMSDPAPLPACVTTVEVAAGDTTRVTLLFRDYERGACASVAATSAEADRLLGLSRGLPAPGLVGLAEDDALHEVAARGWAVRVVARDGETVARSDDHQPGRVDLVIESGRVSAAARAYDADSARCFDRSCAFERA
jgi:hypothetical protein